MPINQYFNYQPLQREDYSFHAPLEMMGKTLSYLQDKSDKNYAALNEVPSLLNVPVLEEDAQNRANIENKYRDRIKQLVDKTGGDYSGVQKEVLSLQNDLRKDLSFSGNLGAMKSNYDAYHAYDKRLKENKTLKDYERYAAIKTARANFGKAGGTGLVDPTTGKYNYFSGIDIDGFDRAKFLNNIKEIKPISEEEVTTYMQNNYIIDRTIGRKGVARERAYAIAKANLRSNENYQQYARQMAAIGIPLSAQDEENALQAFASERSFMEKKDDLKRTWDKNKDYALDWMKFKEDKRHHAQMEVNTAPPPTPTLNLPMQQGLGLDLDKKIELSSPNKEPFSYLTGIGLETGAGGVVRYNVNHKEEDNSRKIMDFNHPFVTGSKTGIEGQALDIAGRNLYEQYRAQMQSGNAPKTLEQNLQLYGNSGLDSKMKSIGKIDYTKPWTQQSKEVKNQILSAMSASPAYKASLESSINNNYSSLARYYNNSSNQGAAIYSNDQATELGTAMNRAASSIPTYEANGKRSDKTLGQEMQAFAAEKGLKDITVLPVAASFIPNLEGYMFTEIKGKDKDGKEQSKQVYVKDDNTRTEQWASDFAAWNPSKPRFVNENMNYERVKSGNIYNLDGSAASSFSIAKISGNKVRDSKGNLVEMVYPSDISGTLFTNNISQLKQGAIMNSLGEKESGGELLGYTQKYGQPVAVFNINGKEESFFVKEQSQQAEATTKNSKAISGNKQSFGYKSGEYRK